MTAVCRTKAIAAPFLLILLLAQCGEDHCATFKASVYRDAAKQSSEDLEKSAETLLGNWARYQNCSFIKKATNPSSPFSVLQSILDEKKSNQVQLANLDSIKIYLENSISMDGYISGVTTFKTSLQRMLIDLSLQTSGSNSLEMATISGEITPIENMQPENFTGMLNQRLPQWSKTPKRGNTDINALIQAALENHSAAGLSIFVSDMIYGISAGNPQSMLPVLKNQIYAFFSKIKKQQNLSVLIIKYNSEYRGLYWDYRDSPRRINGSRPYYVVVFGRPRPIRFFLENIPFENYEGFENYILFDSLEKKKTQKNFKNFAVFCASGDQPACAPGPIKKRLVKSISSIRYDRDTEESTIPVCARLRPSFFYSADQLSDQDAYTLSGIDSIQTIDPSSLNSKGADQRMLDALKPDSCFLINVSKENAKKNLVFAFEHNKQQWVKDTNTDNDRRGTNIEGKTFSFLYFIDALNDAYNKENKNNLRIRIRVN